LKFDTFFSISQTDVDGEFLAERQLFSQFFDQAVYADELGFECAWVAETHLSTETQKKLSYAVVPQFKGEIGLNTDILQLAHILMLKTKKINVGSAIRNILCNGGPMAHAEGVKTFLSLRAMVAPDSDRKLEYGFASGRFDFSNRPYGIKPRNEVEEKLWPIVKGKVLFQASEIFLRLIKGEELASKDIQKTFVGRNDFRTDADWEKAGRPENLEIKPFWDFDVSGVIPKEAPINNVRFTLGSHDEKLQKFVNQFLPVGVFNLSITPPEVIEATHVRMKDVFHKSGGPWQRHMMPRTCLVYVDNDRKKAKAYAESAWLNYWKAVDKTLDMKKVNEAVQNTIAGDPMEVKEMIQNKYHKDDRLMVWFDFNVMDNVWIKNSMKLFMQEVAQKL
jgi:hypothetical protein